MKRFADWRLPVIFAVPILLWAGLLFAFAQPAPFSRISAAGDNFTMTQSPSPSPWRQVNGTPYPTYVWPTPAPTVPCAHQTLDPMAIIQHGPNGTFKYVPAEVCAP